MAQLYEEGKPLTVYRDRKAQESAEEQERKLLQSTTLYVGNLSFYTTEEQLYEVFSKCGDLRRIIMGLDRVKKTPCGFCFVEYYTREDAADAMRFINGTRVDDRIIRTDWDPGFVEGRQWGRGKHGGQVRELFRTDYDPGRGGYGVQAQEALTPQPQPNFQRQRRSDVFPRAGEPRSGPYSSDRIRDRDYRQQRRFEQGRPEPVAPVPLLPSASDANAVAASASASGAGAAAAAAAAAAADFGAAASAADIAPGAARDTGRPSEQEPPSPRALGPNERFREENSSSSSSSDASDSDSDSDRRDRRRR